MSAAQFAFAVLNGLFLVAAVVLFITGDANTFATIFAIASIVGQLALAVLIFYEARQ